MIPINVLILQNLDTRSPRNIHKQLDKKDESFNNFTLNGMTPENIKYDTCNYRSVAITSIISRVLIKVINNKLLTYLENKNNLSDRQYGFRRKNVWGR